MVRTRLKTFRHRVGKNHFLVIQIFQNASAAAEEGNAIANNALSVKIFKQQRGNESSPDNEAVDHNVARQHENRRPAAPFLRDDVDMPLRQGKYFAGGEDDGRTTSERNCRFR